MSTSTYTYCARLRPDRRPWAVIAEGLAFGMNGETVAVAWRAPALGTAIFKAFVRQAGSHQASIGFHPPYFASAAAIQQAVIRALLAVIGNWLRGWLRNRRAWGVKLSRV